MKLHQRILKLIDPKGEAHRREFRDCISHNSAEAEDLTRTMNLEGTDFKLWLARQKDGTGVVRFDSFAHICRYRVDLNPNLCRHPNRAGEDDPVLCLDSACPFMKGLK